MNIVVIHRIENGKKQPDQNDRTQKAYQRNNESFAQELKDNGRLTRTCYLFDSRLPAPPEI